MAHVFISYVRENQSDVDRLSRRLLLAGVDVWLDREQIQPGQRWRDAIRTAIQSGAFFVACFSREYAERKRTYMNEELLLAIDELRQRPLDHTWFIPVLLAPVAIPALEIGGGQTLRDLQWVDLSEDPSVGELRILRIIKPSALDASVAKAREALRETIRQGSSGLTDAMRTARSLIVDVIIDEFARDDNELGWREADFAPVLEENAEIVTAEQVVQLVTRGGRGNSRTGFEALTLFYDRFFMQATRLQLPAAFRNRILSYYCKLREKFPRRTFDAIISGCSDEAITIDGMTIDRHEYWDKFMNRGFSAFLDAVHSVDDK